MDEYLIIRKVILIIKNENVFLEGNCYYSYLSGRMRSVLKIIILLAFTTTALAEKPAGEPTVGVVKEMAVERLPGLNVPRSAHVLVAPGGELTVIGGHSTGFVLTNTAEYYKDGRWHSIETLYPHDFGACALPPSGDVIVAGGCEESFGVGRSFGVERYDPVMHNFTSLPILDRKRARFTMASQADSTFLVSGNWYDPDGIARYTPSSGTGVTQPVKQGRSLSFILQTEPDNAYIFSVQGNQDEYWSPMIVEQLHGDPFVVPIMEEWRPKPMENGNIMERYFIGDKALGGYAWLIPAIRDNGQAGILKLVDGSFSLLETVEPIPMKDSAGHSIQWDALHVDRETESAYLVSAPHPSGKILVCKIGYGEALRGGKAPLTLWSADVWAEGQAPIFMPSVLLPGGRIALVGGCVDDNYHPLADALILHTEPLLKKRTASWWWIVAAILLLAGSLGIVLNQRKKRSKRISADERLDDIEPNNAQVDLMVRIRNLMEEQEFFKKTDLKVEDIAEELGTNVAYVRQCIGIAYGGTFKNFVNEYRIRYVQKQLKDNPEAKITALALDAGFSSTATFYRNFTAFTGLSPAAWLKQS